MTIRIVFMGTRDIAVPVLSQLLAEQARGWQVTGIVTQPDRRAGRSGREQAPPVKAVGVAHAVPLLQPETLRDPAAFAFLERAAPDVGVVASYGLLLGKRVLALPRHGWLNVHPSLLPKHRGPSPVVSTILAGDTLSGVSIIRLVAKMDAGPIIDQVAVPIEPSETAGGLTERLGVLGAQRLSTVLLPWCAGSLAAQPQDETQATTSHMLTRAEGLIDWSLSASELALRVRAFSPWPGAYSFWAGKRMLVWRAVPVPALHGDIPGRISLNAAGHVTVATGDGSLQLLELQLEGKRRLPASDFVRGQPEFVGSILPS
jgi:methionyl-tRNA formyltransferase